MPNETTSAEAPAQESGGLAAKVGEATTGMVGQLTDKAQALASDATASAEPQMEARKTQFLATIDALRGAIREGGEHLRTDEQTGAARFMDMAAERLDQTSRYLEGRNVRSMVADVQDFGRREPLLLAGAAFAAGVIGARLFKSASQTMSSSGSGTTTPSDGAGSGYGYSGGASAPGGTTAYGRQQEESESFASNGGSYTTPGGTGVAR